MRQVSIWQLITYECDPSYYYFGSKQEAQEYKEQWERDCHDANYHCTLHEMSFPMTRDGVASAMNSVIAMLCANEH